MSTATVHVRQLFLGSRSPRHIYFKERSLHVCVNLFMGTADVFDF